MKQDGESNRKKIVKLEERLGEEVKERKAKETELYRKKVG